MIYPKYIHDPQATLDYSIDFSRWLKANSETEVIVSCSWSVTAISGDTAPIVIESSSSDGLKVTVWVSGGTVKNKYLVTAHITTNSTPVAREDDRSLQLICQER